MCTFWSPKRLNKPLLFIFDYPYLIADINCTTFLFDSVFFSRETIFVSTRFSMYFLLLDLHVFHQSDIKCV